MFEEIEDKQITLIMFHLQPNGNCVVKYHFNGLFHLRFYVTTSILFRLMLAWNVDVNEYFTLGDDLFWRLEV
jgi:hypothetical protein